MHVYLQNIAQAVESPNGQTAEQIVANNIAHLTDDQRQGALSKCTKSCKNSCDKKKKLENNR